MLRSTDWGIVIESHCDVGVEVRAYSARVVTASHTAEKPVETIHKPAGQAERAGLESSAGKAGSAGSACIADSADTARIALKAGIA